MRVGPGITGVERTHSLLFIQRLLSVDAYVMAGIPALLAAGAWTCFAFRTWAAFCLEATARYQVTVAAEALTGIARMRAAGARKIGMAHLTRQHAHAGLHYWPLSRGSGSTSVSGARAKLWMGRPEVGIGHQWGEHDVDPGLCEEGREMVTM